MVLIEKENMDTEEIEIFTDGACLGNPGAGGWGVLIRYRETERELSGGDPETTNNQMELTAAIMGLEALPAPSRVTLTTDSTYVKEGITKWIVNWKTNGWQTASNKPVKNVELWQRLDAAVNPHDIKWRWVRGHSGHLENERVDTLARTQALNFKADA